MNMRTRSQRQWRKKAKRGVSPIIATILLVAITVVLAAVLYILISGLTKGPGNTPLGTSLALGTPSEAQKGAGATTNNWYNFTVQSAGGGIILNNIQFQVVTATGSIVTPGGSWTMSALGITGTRWHLLVRDRPVDRGRNDDHDQLPDPRAQRRRSDGPERAGRSAECHRNGFLPGLDLGEHPVREGTIVGANQDAGIE